MGKQETIDIGSIRNQFASRKFISNTDEEFCAMFDDLIYYLRKFWTVDLNSELRINIALCYYFHRSKLKICSLSEFMLAAGVSSYNQDMFKDCYFRSLFYTTKKADKLINTLMMDYDECKTDIYENKSKLCIDFKTLMLFQRLRQIPSVVRFAVDLLNRFGGTIEKNKIVKLMVDYKLNIKVFVLFMDDILRMKYFSALDVREVKRFCEKQSQHPNTEDLRYYCDIFELRKKRKDEKDPITMLLFGYDGVFTNLADTLQLRIKCTLAYYRWNDSLIPDFNVLLQECDIPLDKYQNVVDRYNEAKKLIQNTEKRLALKSRIIEARHGYVMPKFDDKKTNDNYDLLKTDKTMMDEIYNVVSLTEYRFLLSEQYDSESIVYDIEDKQQSGIEYFFPLVINKIKSAIRKFNVETLILPTLNEKYPKYENGLMMRYDIMQPMYESFGEECIMNDEYNISAATFNKCLKKAQSIRKNIVMVASKTCRNFGIRKFQTIDIRHIVAIIIYTDETGYAHALNRSYWSNNHISHTHNFYWFGRYLFESIEYFGEVFNENVDDKTIKIHQGATKRFSFDSFAPAVNYPRSTTSSMKIALQFSTKYGCVLELTPKYTGILNNSKFIDVSTMSKYEDEREKLFFGRGCAVQISNIIVTKNKGSLKNFIAPLLYLEKLVQQTIFDHSFYNSAHLYSKVTKETLYKLIQTTIEINSSTKPSQYITIVNKHFSSTADEIVYTVDLFMKWCLSRSFITFEALPLEIPYMNEDLVNFFVMKNDHMNTKNVYIINIQNISALIPNLKHFRSCDKRIIDMRDYLLHQEAVEGYYNVQIVKLLPNSTRHEIVDHITDALEQINFNFINHKNKINKYKMLKASLVQKLAKTDLSGVTGSDPYHDINLLDVKLKAVNIDTGASGFALRSIYNEIIDNDGDIVEVIVNKIHPKYYPTNADVN
eukprot:468595_1